MIKLRLLRAQTGFDIAQAFAPGELGEGQTEKLIPAGEASLCNRHGNVHAATEFLRGRNPSPEQKSWPLFIQHSLASFAVAVE